MTDDKQLIEHWFKIQSKELQRNAQIVTKEQAGIQYHIDKNTPSQFVPRMPRSAFDDENATTPRFTTAPSILGCMIGYSSYRYLDEFINGYAVGTADKKDEYRGGYEISEIDYSYAIKPNKKLISECDRTDELWLVSYSKSTIAYRPKKIGKMFIHQVVFTNKDHVQNSAGICESYVIYLHHESESDLHLTDKLTVPAGYWKITVEWKSPSEPDVHEENQIRVEKISQSDWTKAKVGKAAMLSHIEKPWMSW